MAKQKQQPAEAKPVEDLEQAAAAALDELEGPQQEPGPNTSREDPRVHTVGYANAEAEIFLSVLRGLRIQVPEHEHPGATAEKAIKLHQELMTKARQARIIA